MPVTKINAMSSKLGIMLASFGILMVLAEIAKSQTVHHEPGSVNTEFSRVYIFVDKSGPVGHQHAIEGRLKKGYLTFNAQDDCSVVFDMKSFDADTVRAREYLGLKGETDSATREKVNANMLGAEVLDCGKYPTAQFDHITLEPKNAMSKRNFPEYVLKGDFTLHGKTKPITIVADLEEKDGWHHLRGSFRIRQSEYGIKPFSKMLGAIGVADELIIAGDFWVMPK